MWNILLALCLCLLQAVLGEDKNMFTQTGREQNWKTLETEKEIKIPDEWCASNLTASCGLYSLRQRSRFCYCFEQLQGQSLRCCTSKGDYIPS